MSGKTPAIRDGMTTEAFLAAQRAAWSEDEFLAAVTALAKSEDWLVYHTRDSRGSAGGFPDLVMVHPEGVLVFAELKRESGWKWEPGQQEWLVELTNAADRTRRAMALASLAASLPILVVRKWHPSNWPEIVRLLTTRRL